MPSAFLRLSHSLQNCGHFIPAGTRFCAFISFHSAPQARSRAYIAWRPPVGLVCGFAGVAGGVAVLGPESPDMHCLLKSRYFIPLVFLSVFSCCHSAAHSFMVLACAGADTPALPIAATKTAEASR